MLQRRTNLLTTLPPAMEQSESGQGQDLTGLNATLAGLGLQGDLQLLGADQHQAAETAGVISRLLSRQRADAERLDSIEASTAILQSDLGMAEAGRRRLHSTLQSKDRELGHVENQLQSLQKEADESMAALTRERDQALKSNADLRRRHEHFQHEIRRKEQEYERLQVKLRELLTEKSRESKASMDAAAAFSRSIRARGPRSDDVQKLMAAHAERVRELDTDNQALRQALEGLHSENRDLINMQQSAHKRPKWASDPLAELQFLESIRGLSPEAVLQQLTGSMQGLQQRLARLQSPPLPQAADGANGGQLQDMHSLMAEQDSLAAAALAALRAGLAQHNNSSSSSSLIPASTQGGDTTPTTHKTPPRGLLPGFSYSSPKGQQPERQDSGAEELESRGAALEQQQAALQAERDSLATERAVLAAQQEELASAVQCFKKAADQWAPGLGAGKFLARAVGKQTLQMMQERSVPANCCRDLPCN